MPLTVTTWNINSVRLRIDLVARFIKAVRPDVICLQETEVPGRRLSAEALPAPRLVHAALNGQKGYHGVAVLSRLPFESVTIDNYCGKADCRHIAVTLGEKAGLRDPVTLHNFYVPAGGDEPDPAINVKFAHKLAFLDELHAMEKLRPQNGERAILVGDLNVGTDGELVRAAAGRCRARRRRGSRCPASLIALVIVDFLFVVEMSSLQVELAGRVRAVRAADVEDRVGASCPGCPSSRR